MDNSVIPTVGSETYNFRSKLHVFVPVSVVSFLQNSRKILKIWHKVFFLAFLAAEECTGFCHFASVQTVWTLGKTNPGIRGFVCLSVSCMCVHICSLFVHTCMCVRESVRVWTEGVSRGRVFCARISRCPEWMQISLAGCPPVPCALTACHLSLSQGERATLSPG